MTISMLDVSSYQSTTFALNGAAAVVVKATEGTSYVNPRHTAQVAHARAGGAVVGHYHFLHHGGGGAQADYFLAHAGLRSGDFIACDWEQNGATQADRDEFMKRISAKAGSYRDVLYCNLNFWKNIDTENFAGDGLWIADPDHAAGKPNVTHAWWGHQYSTAGGIDHSVLNFASKAALVAWAKPTSPAPSKGTTTVTKPLTTDQMVASLYKDLMEAQSLDGDGQHAIAYFAVHARHDALLAHQAVATTNNNVLALSAKVDALTALVEKLAAK